jgi:hypothetical protein
MASLEDLVRTPQFDRRVAPQTAAGCPAGVRNLRPRKFRINLSGRAIHKTLLMECLFA